MDDTLRPILQSLADNPILLKAVKDIISKEFNTDEINTTLSNENLGAIVRARVEGLKKVDNAFKKIAVYQSNKPKLESHNPAR